jgi:hypothetical protein
MPTAPANPSGAAQARQALAEAATRQGTAEATDAQARLRNGGPREVTGRAATRAALDAQAKLRQGRTRKDVLPTGPTRR